MLLHPSLLTDRGLERELNEDNCALGLLSPTASPVWHQGNVPTLSPVSLEGEASLLALVADGMGGRNAGEVASQLLIESLQQQVATLPAPSAETLKSAISLAHTHILSHLDTHPECLGMGTTVAAAWLTATQLHLAWCGDCRCYLFTPKGGLELLTHDHSYVQQLVDEHKITPEEAFDHPDSNLVTRGLGDVDVDNDAETRTLPITSGSLLLLCSDGISGYLRDTQIAQILTRNLTSPQACTQALLQAAYTAGGGDNITAIVLSIGSPRLPFFTRLKHLIGL